MQVKIKFKKSNDSLFGNDNTQLLSPLDMTDLRAEDRDANYENL